MRNVRVKTLLLAVALLGGAPPVFACGYAESIKFQGTLVQTVVRDNHLLCVNDQNHLLVLDLLFTRAFDLGPVEGRRCDGDIADGQALLLGDHCLEVVDLGGGNMVHEVAVKRGVTSFGFAGKGRAFVHYGLTLDLVDLATGNTLNTIELGTEQWARSRSSAWQKVGDRLFVAGPVWNLCVVDLAAGKLIDQYPLESRSGVGQLRVEGDQVHCMGSFAGWGARIDHLTCVDLKTKKCSECELPRTASRFARLGDGPNGSLYVIDRNQIDHFDRAGRRVGTFAPKLGEGVQLLTVWDQQAIVAMKGMVLFLPIAETPVAAN